MKSTEEIDSFTLVVCTVCFTYQEICHKVKNCGEDILEGAISYSPVPVYWYAYLTSSCSLFLIVVDTMHAFPRQFFPNYFPASWVKTTICCSICHVITESLAHWLPQQSLPCYNLPPVNGQGKSGYYKPLIYYFI